jgi:hypothetical protein
MTKSPAGIYQTELSYNGETNAVPTQKDQPTPLIKEETSLLNTYVSLRK